MKTMRLLFLLLTLSVVARAAITTPPQPLPGWPAGSYATTIGRAKDADLAIFKFFDGRKIFIAERAWLDALTSTLNADQATPTGPCFCITDGILELYAKDRRLLSLDLKHDNRISVDGAHFILRAETHASLVKLWAIGLKNERFAPQKSPKHDAPPRVELKP